MDTWDVWRMRLPPGEKLVLLALVETGDPSPGAAAIAAATGYTERHVRTLLGKLAEKEILVERRRAGKKTQYASALTPSPPPSPLPAAQRGGTGRGEEEISGATFPHPPAPSPLRREGDEESSGVGGGKDFTPEERVRARGRAGARDSVVGLNLKRFQIEINNNNRGEEGIDEWGAAREGQEFAQDGEALTPDPSPSGRGEIQEIMQVRGLARATALDLIGRYGVERVLSVARYANRCKRLDNPAGFAVAKLETGWEPPEQMPGEARGGGSLLDGKRYTTGEYAAWIVH